MGCDERKNAICIYMLLGSFGGLPYKITGWPLTWKNLEKSGNSEWSWKCQRKLF